MEPFILLLIKRHPLNVNRFYECQRFVEKELLACLEKNLEDLRSVTKLCSSPVPTIQINAECTGRRKVDLGPAIIEQLSGLSEWELGKVWTSVN